ncbi:hypothetical protein [Psychrobacter sp. AOP29-E1-7]|uniref:hypothetical protein n=1 Tax=Psychrobacter sp. AOP29-E1-7 TaxID=3457702 RepID=UPI004035777F
MPTHPIATYNKSTRLFALYQRLPRHKDKAISLTELMNVYGDNLDHYANERKNLENDLTSLNQIFKPLCQSSHLSISKNSKISIMLASKCLVASFMNKKPPHFDYDNAFIDNAMPLKTMILLPKK